MVFALALVREIILWLFTFDFSFLILVIPRTGPKLICRALGVSAWIFGKYEAVNLPISLPSLLAGVRAVPKGNVHPKKVNNPGDGTKKRFSLVYRPMTKRREGGKPFG